MCINSKSRVVDGSNRPFELPTVIRPTIFEWPTDVLKTGIPWGAKTDSSNENNVTDSCGAVRQYLFVRFMKTPTSGEDS